MNPIHLQVVQHLSPGGIETMAIELLRHSKGIDVHLLSLEGEKQTLIQKWPRLAPYSDRIHSLQKPEGYSLKTLFGVIKLIRRLKPQRVHTHHIGPLLYAGLAARLCRVPQHIHTEHDAWHLCDKRRRRLQNGLLKLINPILVADAKLVADQSQHYLPQSRYRLIHNGIDSEHFYPRDKLSCRRTLNLPEQACLIGCAARLEKIKGIDIAIAALARLPDHVQLAIAGDGSLREQLQAQAEQLNLNGRIHWLGNLDNMELFYPALDVFCMPSRMEGMPLSPLEAQSCGVPTVASNVGGTREALCPRTGTLVPPENPRALADALSPWLLATNDTINTDCRDFIVQHRDIRQMTTAYLQLA